MSRQVVFVLGEKRGRGGSALLRGEQLSTIVAPIFEAAGHPTSVRMGMDGIENSVAIVNKTALLDHGEEGLQHLRARGNRIIIDPIDLPMNTPIWDFPDAILSSSRRQDRAMRERLPDRLCFYIPHHADLRLLNYPYRSGKIDGNERRRCAYVGDPLQGLHLDTLGRRGLLTVIDATNRNGSWMSELPSFAFHYAVRPPQQHQGLFKPFTKGAVAAACGAIVVCDRYDEEAYLSLGSDYPFLLDETNDSANVVASLSRILTETTPDILKQALSAMDRMKQATSPDKIRLIFHDELLASGILD